MADLELEGAKALDAAFREFPKKYANKSLRKTMRDGQKTIVLPDAQKNIAKLTGAMKRGLQVRAAKGKNGARLQRGVFGVATQIKKSIHYAKFVELNRKLRGGGKRKGNRTLAQALYRNRQRLRIFVESRSRADLPRVAEEVRQATKAKG